MTHLDRLRRDRVIQRLLAPFARPGGPGMTLGLILDGTLDVHRSVGLASVELGVPIDPATCFRIASVSKQFTCAAILKLAEQGRLRSGDDVRGWVPELPQFGEPITLDHLMHNTSGLRDMLEIMRLGGLDLSHPCGVADLLEGVCRQRGLNFAPGSRYLYSNSGFMLLGLVVERVSGMSLGAFLREHFFAPLGMNATHHAADVTAVVPGLATGYFRAEGGWQRALHGFPLGGEGGLVSSVQDLALWHAHLSSPAGAALAEALTVPMPFSNGQANDYLRGIARRPHRGVTMYEHGGLWPGYKTAFRRIPERGLGLICITNDAGADPHAVADQAIDAVLDGMAGIVPAPRVPPVTELRPLAGRWVDRAAGATADVAVGDDGAVTVTAHGVPFTARPTEDGRLGAPAGTTRFRFRLLDADTLEVEHDAGVMARYARLAGPHALPAGLDGSYTSDEIAAVWRIEGRALSIAGPLRQGTSGCVEAVEGDLVRIVIPTTLSRAWADVRVLRDGAGRIEGLMVDGGRARGVQFRRLDEVR